MQLVLERRAERSALIAVASPLIAVALTLVTIGDPVRDHGQESVDALGVYFIEPLTDPLFAAGNRRQGDAAGDDRGRSGALLHRQHLEYRRRRPVHRRRGVRKLACRAHQRHRRRALGAAGHAGAGRARRCALCADPGDLPRVFRRQRNPHQPDARLCRQFRHGLSGARALARSAGPELSRPLPPSIRWRRIPTLVEGSAACMPARSSCSSS